MRPTPFCLYRIADTGLSVASGDGFAGEKMGDGVGGAVDGSGRAEAGADFGEAGAEIFSGVRVIEQAQDLLGDLGGREVLLNEFGDYAALGDEVDHTEVRRADQGLG